MKGGTNYSAANESKRLESVNNNSQLRKSSIMAGKGHGDAPEHAVNDHHQVYVPKNQNMNGQSLINPKKKEQVDEPSDDQDSGDSDDG